MENDAQKIKDYVKKRYGSIAQSQGRSCCSPKSPSSAKSCSCSDNTPSYAEQLYSKEELSNLPDEVTNVSLGCGNPTAIAELSEGETVLDLGSGGGIDCFLAAQKVGNKGKVIGLDMTPEMIRLARENAKKIGVSNVEFRLGEIERMPVTDNSIDVIISNCVINLSPDKSAVFNEAFRVLKPGGRMCVSDIVLLGELPQEVQENLAQWAGCVAGALQEKDYLNKIRAAGFTDVTSTKDVIYIDVEDIPEEAERLKEQVNGKVASIRVKAFKPKK